MKKFLSGFTGVVFLISFVHAQKVDTTGSSPLQFKKIILPAALIAFGSLDRTIPALKTFDANVQGDIKGTSKTKLDNIGMVAPGFAVFALKAFGVKSTNTFKDELAIYGITMISQAVVVSSLKKITHELRPDGSSYSSFPSGHTSASFAGAEMLYQEFKHTSKFIGYTGYAVATATGILRMYNNKHWLGDVIAGAGFGILSTKFAYWLEPKIFHHKKRK
jgi:membrane-associated phospholipid phosphatase